MTDVVRGEETTQWTITETDLTPLIVMVAVVTDTRLHTTTDTETRVGDTVVIETATEIR